MTVPVYFACLGDLGGARWHRVGGSSHRFSTDGLLVPGTDSFLAIVADLESGLAPGATDPAAVLPEGLDIRDRGALADVECVFVGRAEPGNPLGTEAYRVGVRIADARGVAGVLVSLTFAASADSRLASRVVRSLGDDVTSRLPDGSDSLAVAVLASEVVLERSIRAVRAEYGRWALAEAELIKNALDDEQHHGSVAPPVLETFFRAAEAYRLEGALVGVQHPALRVPVGANVVSLATELDRLADRLAESGRTLTSLWLAASAVRDARRAHRQQVGVAVGAVFVGVMALGFTYWSAVPPGASPDRFVVVFVSTTVVAILCGLTILAMYPRLAPHLGLEGPTSNESERPQ